MESDVREGLHDLRAASRRMVSLTDDKIKEILYRLAALTSTSHEEILAANQKDLDRMDPEDPKYDRLLLNHERLSQIEQDLRNVAELPSPLHQILEERTVPSGLHLTKISVPLGVIGIVYESRPNVTFDVFALCLKSGNCVALKGGSDAHFSNLAIVKIVREILSEHDLSEAIYLAPSGRAALPFILDAVNDIDIIIPRGSQGLIDFVRAHAKVPVIETGAGIVHTYYDTSAELETGRAIIGNAKTRRVSVCNALDTLLIHRDRTTDLPKLLHGLDEEHELVVYADEEAFDALAGSYRSTMLHHAEEAHFGTEFLSMKMSVRVVDNLQHALDHIATYSSKHSEAIIASDQHTIDTFYQEVDAAAVYSNASTAFTDGAQFGLGAEIGISTQKLHARGPMGLNELTSYKWLIAGSGHIRP
ncbi:MAG: glutamate-5-semialdehyde dehydrogenase [Saprospiraceae bacterium]|nr:glutamate-5-semialdehyde dehydrogenase [Saprospiraceae bacterium]